MAVDFGDWLFRNIDQNELTYREVGEAIGVDKSTISRLVSNENKPSFIVAVKLMEFFDDE